MTTLSHWDAAVVGAANMDICGAPAGPLRAQDSCPGRVRMTSGGVGRNIAHDLCLLGVSTRFIAAMGEDAFRDVLLDELHAVGTDTTLCRSFAGEQTGCYLFITDRNGEMQLAINAMDVSRLVTPQFLEERMAEINRCRLCFADANLSVEALEYLLEACTVPLFCDPISVAKAQRLSGRLDRLHTVKPNRAEAEALSGVTIRSETDLMRAADILLEKGVHSVFISLGADGAYAADRTGTRLRLPCFPAAVRSTTGAGDSFAAAIAYGHLRGFSLREQLLAGLAAGAVTTESETAVNPLLSEAELLRRAGPLGTMPSD